MNAVRSTDFTFCPILAFLLYLVGIAGLLENLLLTLTVNSCSSIVIAGLFSAGL